MFGTGDVITDDGLNEIYYDFIREKLKERFFKKNGLKDGIFESFNEDGEKKEYGNYKQDKKHGEWIYYKEHVDLGNSLRKSTIEKIKEKETGKYKLGKKDGEWKYYKDNVLYEIILFENDKKISQKYFDENGNLKREDSIVNSKILSKYFLVGGEEVMKYEDIIKKTHEEKTILSPVIFDDWKEKEDIDIGHGFKLWNINFDQETIPVETWYDSNRNVMSKEHVRMSFSIHKNPLLRGVRFNYGNQVTLKLKIINEFIFVEENDDITFFSGSLNHTNYLNGEKIK